MLKILEFVLPNIVQKFLDTVSNQTEIENFDYNPTPDVGKVYEDDAHVSLYEGLSEIIPNFDVELIKTIEFIRASGDFWLYFSRGRTFFESLRNTCFTFNSYLQSFD